ncbi:MAG: MopE-related protein [Myxococcales bacterium]
MPRFSSRLSAAFGLLCGVACIACHDGASPGKGVLDAGHADAGMDATLPDADGSTDAALDGASALMCPAEELVPDGCLVLGPGGEAAASLCDGYDNDCNGLIDDGCTCVVGSVQDCFDGPPGHAKVGACQHGTQVCYGGLEFAGWGPCERGISPQPEVCDRLDNDCNGCVDEREDCNVFIDCPGEDDVRLPPVKPFAVTTLDAAMFYNGNDVASYTWSVAGSPCDELFASIPGFDPKQSSLSYTLQNANAQQAQVKFTLSGTYLVTLTIVRTSGDTLGCTFPLVVGAGGLRVELCWDKTGPTSVTNFVDLDLHLALQGRTSKWYANNGADKDLYAFTFANENFTLAWGVWGHPPSPDVSGCLTGGLPGSADQIHQLRNNCVNPRLDLDNQGNTSTKRYLPENINLDNPRAGEIFQVAVDHVTGDPIPVRALVNVYCGGKLRGSYQLDPTKTPFSDTANAQQELWRVAQIAPVVSAQGVTTDCAVTPLHPSDAPQDNLVTVGDSSITWSQ